MTVRVMPPFFMAMNLLFQKRVSPNLRCDGGVGAVAGVDDGLRREGKQLGFDTLHQGIIIAVDKVVTPDSVIK